VELKLGQDSIFVLTNRFVHKIHSVTMNISSVEIRPMATPFPNENGEVVGQWGKITPHMLSEDESSSPVKMVTLDQKPVKGVKIEEKKKRRKKKWTKPKDKPSRPLSAYNLFFQSARANMLGDDAPTAALESLKKRVHCKTHGKIGFAEMARAIGAKWKALEPEKRKVFEDKAGKEKQRYAVELAAWKEAKAAEGERNGLDAMATAAMGSDPIESDQSTCTSHSELKHSDSLRMAMADEVHRRNHLSMLQHRPQELDYIRAMQDRQVDRAALLNLSRFDSNLINYPSAAEASANAILQQFQGFQGIHQSPPPPSPRQSAQSHHHFFDSDRLSQLPVSYPANLAAMRQLQYMSNNGLL
jgi:hypothetical protein